MFYIAYLLTHPNEPIHALDLISKIPQIYRHQLGLPEITDPATGKKITLQSHARLQERSLALDDREALRRLWKEQKKLELILDDESSTEPERAEALRELAALTDFTSKSTKTAIGASARATHTVRVALKRLLTSLRRNPDKSRSSFADHLNHFLVLPSSARHSALIYAPPNTPDPIHWD